MLFDLGFCIGGPFAWNLIKRAGDRVVAAVLAQPSGFRPAMPDLFYQNNIKGWGPPLCERRPDVAMETVHLAPNAQVSLYPWKDTPDKIPLAVRHVRAFLRAHRPAAAAHQPMAAAAQ